MNTVQIRLFGAFRNYSKESEISLPIDSASSLTDIKASLLEKLSNGTNEDAIRTLLSQSAMANETRVLENSELVLPGMKLAILPPVCGG